MFTGIFIPEGLVRSSIVGPGAKLAWGRLARYAGEDGHCYPAIKVLAAEIGVRERQAQNYLGELETAKLIRRISRFNGRAQASNAYEFLWHDVFSTGMHHCAGGGVQDRSPGGGPRAFSRSLGITSARDGSARPSPTQPRARGPRTMGFPGCLRRHDGSDRGCRMGGVMRRFETRKAAGVESGGWREADFAASGLDRVGARAVLSLRGQNREAQLLADGPRKEAAHGIRLPARGAHQLYAGDSTRPFQQVENLSLLPSREPLAFVAPLGAFFAGLAFLPDLAFLAATGARRGAAGAFFFALGLATVVFTSAVAVSSVLFVIRLFFLWGGDYRVTHGSLRLPGIASGFWGNRERRCSGDEARAQMWADVVRCKDTERNSGGKRKKRSPRCLPIGAWKRRHERSALIPPRCCAG